MRNPWTWAKGNDQSVSNVAGKSGAIVRGTMWTGRAEITIEKRQLRLLLRRKRRGNGGKDGAQGCGRYHGCAEEGRQRRKITENIIGTLLGDASWPLLSHHSPNSYYECALSSMAHQTYRVVVWKKPVMQQCGWLSFAVSADRGPLIVFSLQPIEQTSSACIESRLPMSSYYMPCVTRLLRL